MSDNRRRKSRLLRIETSGGKLLERGRGSGEGAGRELPGQDYVPQHAWHVALGISGNVVILPGLHPLAWARKG